MDGMYSIFPQEKALVCAACAYLHPACTQLLQETQCPGFSCKGYFPSQYLVQC